MLYPLFDVAAAIVDARSSRATGSPALLYVNIAISLLAAVGLGVAGASGIPAVLRVWGAWAVVAGLVQLIVAVTRRKMGGQWPMIISGGISVLAGGSFFAGRLRGQPGADQRGRLRHPRRHLLPHRGHPPRPRREGKLTWTTTRTTSSSSVRGRSGRTSPTGVVQGGLSAAIVERELVGGECSYWACMPTKALLRSAAALRAARQLPGAREAVTGDLDVAAVLRRRDSFASHWKDDGQVSWLESAGIALLPRSGADQRRPDRRGDRRGRRHDAR